MSNKRIMSNTIDYLLILTLIKYFFIIHSFIQQTFAEKTPAGKGTESIEVGGGQRFQTGVSAGPREKPTFEQGTGGQGRRCDSPGRGPRGENSQFFILSMKH